MVDQEGPPRADVVRPTRARRGARPRGRGHRALPCIVAARPSMERVARLLLSETMRVSRSRTRWTRRAPYTTLTWTCSLRRRLRVRDRRLRWRLVIVRCGREVIAGGDAYSCGKVFGRAFGTTDRNPVSGCLWALRLGVRSTGSIETSARVYGEPRCYWAKYIRGQWRNSARRRAKRPHRLAAYERFLLSRTRIVCLEPAAGASSCSSKFTSTLRRTERMSALPA